MEGAQSQTPNKGLCRHLLSFLEQGNHVLASLSGLFLANNLCGSFA